MSEIERVHAATAPRRVQKSLRCACKIIGEKNKNKKIETNSREIEPQRVQRLHTLQIKK